MQLKLFCLMPEPGAIFLQNTELVQKARKFLFIKTNMLPSSEEDVQTHCSVYGGYDARRELVGRRVRDSMLLTNACLKPRASK